MDRKYLITAATVLAAFLSMGWTAHAQGELTGDTRLACEAQLCLATAAPPAECAPALRRYFGIAHRRSAETARRRHRFLRLCPVAQAMPLPQIPAHAQRASPARMRIGDAARASD